MTAKDKLIAQLKERVAELEMRLESRDQDLADLRKRKDELEYLLDQYEQREEEEDVLENYEPKAVIVIETKGEYQPRVYGPFLNRREAAKWDNAYTPQPGEVVHVLETDQP